MIFGLFERMRLVEQIGSGISRIRSVMHVEGLTPPEFSLDGMFTVVLRRPFDFEKWVKQWVKNLSEKQILILEAIHNDNTIKKAALAKRIGFSATALDNNIEIIKKNGLLGREGTKGGIWRIYYLSPKMDE